MGQGQLLEDLALVLCTAAFTAVLCHRLRQPLILGYLLAGVLVGPHLSIFPNADEGNVRVLSELGVTLLMFSIGLNFSVRRFVQLMPTAGVLVAVAVPLLFTAGFLVAAPSAGPRWSRCSRGPCSWPRRPCSWSARCGRGSGARSCAIWYSA
jgi:Kef-type K+ transport system membrane component KefB